MRKSADGDGGARRPAKRLSGFFIVIIVFKFLKAAALLFVGAVVLRLVHVMRHEPPMRVASFLNAGSDREGIRWLSRFFDQITPGQREAIGLAAIAVGVVFAAEGVLLLARVWWATYLTIGLTLLGIPIEVLEIWRRPDRFRSWLYLIINVATLVYLWRRRNEFRDEFEEPQITAR